MTNSTILPEAWIGRPVPKLDGLSIGRNFPHLQSLPDSQEPEFPARTK